MFDGVFIFLMLLDLMELKYCIIGCGIDDMSVINKWMVKVVDEIKMMCNYDYVVINDEVLLVVEWIKVIICSEWFSVKWVMFEYEEMLGDVELWFYIY